MKEIFLVILLFVHLIILLDESNLRTHCHDVNYPTIQATLNNSICRVVSGGNFISNYLLWIVQEIETSIKISRNARSDLKGNKKYNNYNKFFCKDYV